ncbi:MAG: MOSC domain-containing protein [Nitriliruptorales bacterium]|nr:MOSC domain-containing protein [Nitriliruptorales bacterium]
MSTVPSTRELVETVPQVGRLEWIGLRPAHRAAVTAVDAVEVREGLGLDGDRRAAGEPNPDGKRHVTLIQAEHLPVVAGLVGHDVDPSDLRRNLVVSGIPLLGLRDLRFRIGSEVVLEGTGHCHPCSRMEENLGAGGFQAMRGHGGITARVIAGGTIRVGDEVTAVRPSSGQD